MDKFVQTLTELLVLQRSQLTIGEELTTVLDQEEELALNGFTVASLQDVIALKDQVIHRFLGAENKRQSAVRRLCFLIGFDARGGVPSLTAICAALAVYARTIEGLLSPDDLSKSKRSIEIYCTETERQIPHFESIANRVAKNKIVVQRLLSHVNSSVRFFEQAFRVVDSSYDKGGRIQRARGTSSRLSQLAIKA